MLALTAVTSIRRTILFEETANPDLSPDCRVEHASTVIARTGSCAYCRYGGPTIKAKLNSPAAVAVDARGRDTDSHCGVLNSRIKC